ncbi:MAG: SCO family protein [Paracoccaceae bacterium]
MRESRTTVGAAGFLMGIALVASLLSQLHSAHAWAHDRPHSDRPQSAAPTQPANRGPFSLMDHRGRTVTDKDFVGKFMLVYFGYTHCPDLCPIDLQVMAQAIEILGDQGEKVQPIFITVDPKRDTVEVMAEFVRRFHPRLIGLTGTREQVDAAASIYRVRRMKFFPLDLDDDNSRSGATEGDSRYVVDHTASFFLIGPDVGGLVRYAHGITAEEIAEDVQQFINAQP